MYSNPFPSQQYLSSLANVSLMMDTIIGTEGATAHVCASLSYDEHYNITVSVDVVPSVWDDPETAGMLLYLQVLTRCDQYSLTLDINDFSPVTQTMVFNSAEACVDILLYDDDMVELDSGFFRETFRVSLEPNDDYSVLFGETRSARVGIKDNDSE